MKLSNFDYVDVGTNLTLTFALLIALILGGGGLVVWQFGIANSQSDRLGRVGRQLVAVQQLQEQLFTFHGRLEEIARSRDANRLLAEAQPLITPLLQQTQRVREAFKTSPSEIPADSFNAIDVTLPSQLEGVTALARSGDWEAVNLRLENQLKPMEDQISVLVHTTSSEVNREMAQAVATMRNLQSRILAVVTTTAIATFLVAAFFGWSIARRMIELRIDERVQERTRIARDLHDTLLQSFQGLMLKFRALGFLLPDRPAEARKMLEEVIEQARAAITEGRDAVHGLRSSTIVTNDLAQAISALGEQLNADQSGRQSPDFRVHVEGATREIVPLLRDDVYRIAGEALRNAFRHAHARQVEVEIRYDRREFHLRVGDDGKGIDPSVLSGDGKGGHYGLPGMHERAKLIGGKLEVWSELNSGTEVELTIPASLAYVEPSTRRGLRKNSN